MEPEPELDELMTLWTEGSSVILDHFVAYVKGAADTGLHLGQPPN